MKEEQVIDYQAALDEFRRNEHEPDNPVQSSGLPERPPLVEGYVDYLSAVKAWDKEPVRQNAIQMHNGKRNPSHDPVWIRNETDA